MRSVDYKQPLMIYISSGGRGMPYPTQPFAAPFAALRDGRQVKSTIRVLRDVVAGRKVSDARLTRAQELLVNLLEEINFRRPSPIIHCGGR